MPSPCPPPPPLLALALLPLSLLLALHPPATAAFDVDARSRQEWASLIRICPNRNFTSCSGIDRSTWTDATKSQFTDFNFRGLAQWSTFKIFTHDFTGARKTKGGDSWYIVLRDRQQRLKVPTRVFDEGDGSYTVAAYFLMPGEFTVLAWLWYSDCHGLQQPALHMREYDAGGKRPLVKADHCYVGGRTKLQGFPAIDRGLAPPPCMQPGCAPQAAPATDAATGGALIFRMETYFYRQNHTYLSSSCCKPRFPKPSFPVKRFLFYGDSTVKNSWEMLQYMARQLCVPMWKPRLLHEMFDPAVCPRTDDLAKVDPELDAVLKRCTGGAPWTTVPIGTNTIEVSRYHPLSMLYNMDNFTYNDTYARNHVPPVPLPLPREFTFVYIDGWGCRGVDGWGVAKDLSGIRAGDVAVINIGAHCSRSMPFEEWQTYMDKLVVHLNETIRRTGTPIIWRTSFLMKEHVFRSYSHADGYVPPAHFNTEHRRLIFDSYAEHVLIPIGVHIWDVYGISHMGDYRPHDMVHSDGMTCWAMNTDMMDLFACHA